MLDFLRYLATGKSESGMLNFMGSFEINKDVVGENEINLEEIMGINTQEWWI